MHGKILGDIVAKHHDGIVIGIVPVVERMKHTLHLGEHDLIFGNNYHLIAEKSKRRRSTTCLPSVMKL